MRLDCRIPSVLAALGFALLLSGSARADSDAVGREFFENRIRPVLIEQCYSCHSEEAATKKKLRGGLYLDTREGLLKGGDSGAVIVAGKPDASLLFKSLQHTGDVKMPLKGKLADKVVADFRHWIEMGAPDPRDGKVVSQQGVDLARGRKFWAFQPPQAGIPPGIEGATTDIDRFLLAKLREKQLPVAEPADPRMLIRRLSLDLIGLPPTAEQVTAFEEDFAKNRSMAVSRLVDGLLASPHHGERWARHWLDVARYAEDQAHTFGVKPKTNAYRYRDWVIQALNDDMPYDRFVRLQIAGDLVPESEGSIVERTAGLGLLGLGAEYYKNSAAEQAAADELDDRVDTITRGFLGLTVSCARCHDHKFDPIPQVDYYSLAGIFKGSTLTEAPLATAEEVQRYNQGQASIKEQEDRIKALLAALSKNFARESIEQAAGYLTTAWQIHVLKQNKVAVNLADVARSRKLDPVFLDRWLKLVEAPGKSQLVPREWAGTKMPSEKPKDLASVTVPAEVANFAAEMQKKAKTAFAANKMQDGTLKLMLVDAGTPFHLTPAEVEQKFAGDADRQKLTEMRGDLEQRRKNAPPMYATAHVLRGGGTGMKVFIRGNVLQPGEMAPKGFLQVVAPALEQTTPSQDYTRLHLADAIASPKNPLTARVIVNRVWQWHFGRGLVGTPSNFGELGERPTHPELLDWLTVRFIQNGWSLKWLHRQIVLTDAYQRTSVVPVEEQKLDPENVYLGRMSRRRLEVEVYRDSLLAVSGKLDSSMGGPTYDLRNPNILRRTVYGKISRHELNGLLRLFDFPDANVTADRRVVTTVPQQQLFVLNSEFMLNLAKAFAERIEKGAGTDTERVNLAYRLAFGRLPSERERTLGLAFIVRPMPPEASSGTPTRWQQYAHALLATNELLYVD